MSDWWQDCEKEVLKLLGIQTIKSTQEQQKMAGNLNVEREQIYIDFLHEAQELLQIIEQELLSLREDHSTAKVHNLMRAAHTLKGSSASMELQNLSQIAHGLEGVFKSLYNPELQIDAELESLLFKAYEYLQLAVTEASLRRTQNNPKILNQAASALAAVQQKLGSYFNPDAEIPSSEELGFDIVGSIFEVGVQQRIEELERAIATGDKETISNTITAANTIFMGLAESLNLPGFGEIAQLTEIAVERYPQHILEIAPIALENLVAAQKQVLEGDREEGGQASESLRAWVLETLPEATEALFDASTTIDIDCAQMWDLAPETVAVPESKNGSDRASEPSIDSIFGNISTNDLEEFGHFDSIPEETETVDFSSQIEPVEDIDPILEPASTPIETENPNPPTPVPLSNSHQTVRVEVDRLEQLNFQAGELLIEQNNRVVQNDLMLGAWRDLRSRMQQHAKTLNRLLSWQLSQVETQWVSQGLTRFSSNEGLSSPHLTHLDSLELEQYSELRLLLQKAQEEMVQMEECAEGLDLFTRSSHQTLQKQQRLLKTVQDNLTWARMQEFGSTLERLERLVQQLHHQHQKEVEFSLEGAKVPIDKAIAQNLYDPLLHLVRNAFAHGIESPEERTQQGKPAVGRITIRAYNQGNRTFIEVKDDGRGIDYPKIRDRALERNLITATQNLTPQELHNLIFTPGFSTAPDVDDLRGRGVGLDVVQSYITAINATLAVHTQAQQGTTFTIRLPLTLSIAKLIVCQVGKLAYAVPADSIDQIILLQPHQVKQIGPQRVLQWQKSRSNGKTSPEQTLPLYRLGDLIHYTSPLVPPPNPTSANSMVMLLKLDCSTIGIEVDRVLGEQELTLRPLGSAIAPPAYVDGCSVLGDNRLALALDLIALVESRLNQAQDMPSLWDTVIPDYPPPSSLANPPQSSILIVDDSITLRRNLKLTLKKAGYSVLEASDGLNAIAQLEQYAPQINLIVSDLEMPQMNGFELLNYCQQHPQYQKIPILVLTSRQSDKHRQIALNLGASSYITKPYLERDLLIKIGEYLPTAAVPHHNGKL